MYYRAKGNAASHVDGGVVFKNNFGQRNYMRDDGEAGLRYGATDIIGSYTGNHIAIMEGVACKKRTVGARIGSVNLPLVSAGITARWYNSYKLEWVALTYRCVLGISAYGGHNAVGCQT